MADDITVTNDTDFSVDAAASAIDALLNPKQPDAAPATTENQSQPSAPAQASEVETPEGELQQEAAPDTAALEVKAEPSQPVQTNSPELEQAKAEAARKIQEADTARSQFLNALNTYVPQLEAAIKGEFADIKSFDDLQRVANEDPTRYNRYVIANARLQEAQRTQQAAEAQANQQANERRAQWQASERSKLEKAIPELLDPDKGPALAKKIEKFALSGGYTAQQLAQASATDFVMLHQAMQFKDLQAAQKAALAKAAKAPPVQTPGTPRQTNTKDDKITDDFARLQKSGHISDAAAVFRNFIN